VNALVFRHAPLVLWCRPEHGKDDCLGQSPSHQFYSFLRRQWSRRRWRLSLWALLSSFVSDFFTYRVHCFISILQWRSTRTTTTHSFRRPVRWSRWERLWSTFAVLILSALPHCDKLFGIWCDDYTTTWVLIWRVWCRLFVGGGVVTNHHHSAASFGSSCRWMHLFQRLWYLSVLIHSTLEAHNMLLYPFSCIKGPANRLLLGCTRILDSSPAEACVAAVETNYDMWLLENA